MPASQAGRSRVASPRQRNSLSSRTPHQGQDIRNIDLASVQVGEGADAALIDGALGSEAPEIEVCRGRMWGAVRDQVCRGEAPGRDRLEAAIAPAAIENQSLDR